MKAPLAVLLGLTSLAAAGAAGCDRARQAEAAASSRGAESGAPAPSEAGRTRAATPPAPSPAAPEPRTVSATAGAPISRTLLLDSHLLVERDVTVTARRDGFIEQILADRGRLVKEGDLLALLEHGDLIIAEKTAMLELEKQQASYDRAARLHDQEIIPGEEFEQVRLRRDAAEKELERIRYEIERCRIRAPFDGVVTGRFVEKGQVLKEDDGRPLFQVTALGPLLARVYLPEWALFGVEAGRTVEVTPTAAFPSAGAETPGAIGARVRWINHALDAASGSAEMLVEVAGGPGSARLRPGMSVQVRIELSYEGSGPAAGASGRRDLISLPREAMGGVEPSPGQRIDLKVLAANGSVEPRSVVVGFVGDERVEVRRGLSPGEKVILGSAAAPAAPPSPSPPSSIP